MIVVMVCYKVNILGPKGSRSLLIVRGLIGLFGVIFFYFGLLFIPPSDCSAIAHCSIIITAILSRLFLKEKLGIPHIIALLFTIAGVTFISKPTILFPVQNELTSDTTQSINVSNQTVSYKNINIELDESLQIVIGILCVVSAALFFGILSLFVMF